VPFDWAQGERQVGVKLVSSLVNLCQCGLYEVIGLGRYLTERFLKNMAPISKNFLQFALDNQFVYNSPQGSQRKGVVYNILYLDSPFYFPKQMLMMPEAVGTEALFVYKEMASHLT
jgi:hypothetical protein